MALLPPGVVIDINKHSVNNYDDIRRRNTFSNNVSFRSVSVSLSTFSILYHDRIIINNDLPNQEHIEPIDNSQLFYSGNDQESN